MALVDAYTPQKVVIHRDTVMSDEERAKKNAELVRKALAEFVVGAGRAIRVEDAGATKTYHSGDPIRRSLDVRAAADFNEMLRKRDVLKLSESQLLINANDPRSRYIVNPQGSAISVATGIIGPGEVVAAANCHKDPDPAVREKVRGGWVEVGERHPGLDGEEVLKSCIERGLVVDRKLSDKVKAAAKRVLSKASKTASK